MKYFVKPWLVCRQIWNTQPIPPLYDDKLGDYGQIDQFIRNWIVVRHLRTEFFNLNTLLLYYLLKYFHHLENNIKFLLFFQYLAIFQQTNYYFTLIFIYVMVY